MLIFGVGFFVFLGFFFFFLTIPHYCHATRQDGGGWGRASPCCGWAGRGRGGSCGAVTNPGRGTPAPEGLAPGRGGRRGTRSGGGSRGASTSRGWRAHAWLEVIPPPCLPGLTQCLIAAFMTHHRLSGAGKRCFEAGSLSAFPLFALCIAYGEGGCVGGWCLG